MIIAHFIDTDVMGGAEVLIEALCKAALTNNDTPLLLHFGHNTLAERLSSLGVRNIKLDSHIEYKSKKKSIIFAMRLRETLRQERIDILHTHLFGPTFAGGLATLFCRTTHVGTLHDRYILEEAPYRVKLIGIITFFGSRICSVSESISKYVLGNSLIRRKNLRTIYNGVRQPKASKNKNTLRRELNISAKNTVAICVGRLVPIKNHKLLINAWAGACPAKDSKLIIVGDGPERSALERQVSSLGISDQVTFAGFRNDVEHLLQLADLFVLTSDSEGLSCSILEAMANNLAALVTDVGGNSELVVDRVNGFICPKSDRPHISATIKGALQNPDLLKAMGVKSGDRVKELFSMETMFNKYWQIYESK